MSCYPFPQVELPFKTPSITETNSINTSLLTPPITPRSEKDVPFKPAESDTTSLNMTKKHLIDHQHHHRRHEVRACASSNDAISWKNTLSKTKPYPLPRSKSTPVRHICPPSDTTGAGLVQTYILPCHGDAHVNKLRRWTLPGKSGATRGLTTLKPTVKHQTQSEEAHTESSPALITLRRATAKSSQHTNLTFFPPPTFTRTKSSFMSYIMKQVASQNEHTTENMDFLSNQVYHSHKNRAASIVVGMAHPTMSVVAGPALTEVLPDAPFAHVNNLEQNRRCSTRYMTDSSAYEVIWNENDTPSGSSESSAPLSTYLEIGNNDPTSKSRRQSAVMDALEMQLSKADAHSRRTSQHEHESRPVSRESFQSMINSTFSRFINNSALQNLPRSRKTHNPKCPAASSLFSEQVMHQTIIDDPNSPAGNEHEVFPPLQSRKNSTLVEDITETKNRKQSMMIPDTTIHRTRMGSLLGSSSHVRRKSVLKQEDHSTWQKRTNAIRKQSNSLAADGQLSNLERMPLLDTMGWEEQNPW